MDKCGDGLEEGVRGLTLSGGASCSGRVGVGANGEVGGQLWGWRYFGRALCWQSRGRGRGRGGGHWLWVGGGGGTGGAGIVTLGGGLGGLGGPGAVPAAPRAIQRQEAQGRREQE